MTRRLALAVLAALSVSAAPLRAAEPQTLTEAQAQLRDTLAQARKAREAAAQKKAAAAAPKLAELSCAPKTKGPGAYGLTGVLDLGALTLQSSRSPGVSAPIAKTDAAAVVDERCGSLLSPLAENLNYYVTPLHYWGEDILQLPKAAARADGQVFQAYLHTCEYDGEWHADWDAVLDCTLKPR